MAFAVYDHTPLVGYIQWQDLHIAYKGTSYAITNGYTSDPYVWWDPEVSTTTLQTGTSLPTLSDDALLVFLNKSGVHVTVPTTTVVDGSLIVEESILTNALAANSVTTDKIVAGAIISEKIGAGEVLALNLAAGSVEADKIAANAVTAGKIAAGAVVTDKIAANAVNADKIAANAVEADAIAANAVTTDKLSANAVTAAKLASIDLEVGKHIRSTTYTPGSDGWSIEADGSAEFNDVTVRGSVAATTFSGTGTSLLSGMTAADWTFESGSGTVTKLSDNHYRISFTTAGDVVSPYINSASPPHYSLHSIEVQNHNDPLNGLAAFGLEQENGGFYQLINMWPSIPSFHRMPLHTRWDGVRFVMSGQAGCFYDVFVEAIDPADLGGVVITESTKVIGNLDLESDPTAYGHMGHLNAAGYVAAGAGITAVDDIATIDGRFLAPSGSSEAPAYSFAEDLDTGIYRSGDNAIAFGVGGLGILRLDRGGPSNGRRVTIFGLPTTSGSANLHIDAASGVLSRISSTRRIKTDIETLDESVVDRLRPVTYRSTAEGADPEKVYVGFIAEEVAEADPRLAEFDEEGEVNYFDQNGLMAHIVKELQSLRKRVADLEAERGQAA